MENLGHNLPQLAADLQRYNASAPAQYWLGNMYHHGKGVPKDLEQAAHYFVAPSDKGNAAANHSLALILLHRDRSDENSRNCYYWASIAAALGEDAAVSTRDTCAVLLITEQRKSIQADKNEAHEKAMAARSFHGQ